MSKELKRIEIDRMLDISIDYILSCICISPLWECILLYGNVLLISLGNTYVVVAVVVVVWEELRLGFSSSPLLSSSHLPTYNPLVC